MASTRISTRDASLRDKTLLSRGPVPFCLGARAFRAGHEKAANCRRQRSDAQNDQEEVAASYHNSGEQPTVAHTCRATTKH